MRITVIAIIVVAVFTLGMKLRRGTFFLTTDITPLSDQDGHAFCLELLDRCGAVAIPSSVFHNDKDAGRPYVRRLFSKRPEVLEEAVERLGQLR